MYKLHLYVIIILVFLCINIKKMYYHLILTLCLDGHFDIHDYNTRGNLIIKLFVENPPYLENPNSQLPCILE